MNDDRHEPLDDELLRDALRAEAEGVEAGDDLLGRIHRAPAAKADHRKILVLVAAASVVAVLAVGFALQGDDGREEPLMVDVPDVSTSTSTSTTACVGDPTGNPPCGDALVGAPRPTLVALVREDGWVVTVDLATGTETELAFVGPPGGNPGVELPEGASSVHLDSVELDPSGQWLYVTVCCEPAVGTTYRIPVDEPVGEDLGPPVAYGTGPAVSPDGRFLATVAGDVVEVTDLSTLDQEQPTRVSSESLAYALHGLAWSPDGTQLAYVEGGGTEPVGQMRLLGWDETSLTPRSTGKPSSPASFVGWSADGMPVAIEGEPIVDDRAFSQDRSYQWQLRTDEGGRLLVTRFDRGDEETLVGLPPALDADW